MENVWGELPVNLGKLYRDANARETRIERTIGRVQALRERAASIAGDLNETANRVVGVFPQVADEKWKPHEPNGLLETLDYNLDLLESELAGLAEAALRLRDGL